MGVTNSREQGFKRAQERFKRIISRADFQADIRQLREKWNIPPEGIQDIDASQHWYRSLSRASDQYQETKWPKVRKKIIALKEKATLEDYQKSEDVQKKFNEANPLNAFYASIKKLLKKYNLDPYLEDTIRAYLFSNTENLCFGVTIQKIHNKDDTVELHLIIHAETRLSDIKAAWPNVQDIQSTLPYYKNAKYQPSKNFDRDQRAYELQLEGKTHKQIAAELKKEFGGILTYTDIGKIIERHKKRLGIL